MGMCGGFRAEKEEVYISSHLTAKRGFFMTGKQR